MHDIHKLKKMLCDELAEYGRKSELTSGTLEVVDKLAHAVKNLDKIIKSHEEEYSGDYHDQSYRGSYDGGSYDGGSYDGGNSYRGRRNARRDSMGRYARDGGYSRSGEDLAGTLRQMMQDPRFERLHSDMERLAERAEHM